MKKWTKEEVDFLRNYYPTKGYQYCVKKLNRSYKSILTKASRLQIKSICDFFETARIGEKHLTNEGYEIEIIEYFNRKNCTIKFLNSVKIKNVQYPNILSGAISNPYHKSVYGVGYVGVGKYISSCNGSTTKVYQTWYNMLSRCYDNKNHSYKEVIICEEWGNFQTFAQWFENNYIEDFALDKDILVKGNKVYSPETCCFVPQEINSLFIKSTKSRGLLPIGVHEQNNKFISSINRRGKQQDYLGSFDTPEEAFQAYKIAKEVYIKEVADKWRDIITEQVYQAMINYKVTITD